MAVLGVVRKKGISRFDQPTIGQFKAVDRTISEVTATKFFHFYMLLFNNRTVVNSPRANPISHSNFTVSLTRGINTNQSDLGNFIITITVTKNED
jgi:hypothetical protein